MVGLVIVSHSCKIAEGVVDLASQMAPDYDGLRAAGGMEDGEIGTDAMKIMNAVQEVNTGDGVLILCDLGSAIMSAETAIDFLEEEDGPVKIADAPLVEGAIVAAVEASIGKPLDEVLKAAEDARNTHKINE